MDLAFIFIFKMLLSTMLLHDKFLMLENFFETVLLGELPPLVTLTQNKCGLKDCL